ncbi:MAG TPA: PEP/pyruvate-binding domain-containing protein, partial [Spirochaetia bacterium]|nr:PEP/pyruvate-binding domain-containing protein [Spirochaetia bacterium]
FDVLRKQINHPDLFFAVSVVKEGEIAPPLFKNQDFENEALCITFDKLIHQSLFLPLVRKILSRLEEAYGHPVDVEFVWDDNKFYLLQCRTLSTRKEMGRVSVPKKVPREETLFSVHSGLSDSLVKDLEYIIYVDPKAYNEIKVFEDKVKIMRIVSGLNHYLLGKRFALMGPGRWGSNDINLGVQVKYGDIKNARLLVEIAFAQDGLTPEVSYGTHFFQDLVESDISIFPIFPDNPQDFLNEEYLLQRKNRLGELLPEYGDLDRIVHVIHVPSESPGKLLQVVLDGRKQEGVGYFDGKDG